MYYAYRADAWQTLYTAVAGLLLLRNQAIISGKVDTSTNRHRSKQSAKKIIADILSAICPLFIFLYIALSKQTVEKK